MYGNNMPGSHWEPLLRHLFTVKRHDTSAGRKVEVVLPPTSDSLPRDPGRFFRDFRG
jgi:hypothetical protein